MLRRAGAALNAGDPAQALHLIGQHAASFPNGVLIEEREAERIVVLCALGRVSDARAAGAAFLRDFVAEAKASGLVARLIERHKVRGLSVSSES